MRSVASYEAYWERWAQPWEFQALLKARPVAGDGDLGAGLRRRRGRTALWDRPFAADDIRSVRAMKGRAEARWPARASTDREIKRGRGGIRDIEFAVQLLQLVHGRLDPALRSPTTLDALGELAAAGYVDADDADHARRGLPLPAPVEHRLQLVDEQQVHAVPAATPRPRPAGPQSSATAAPGGRRRRAAFDADLGAAPGRGPRDPRAALVPAAARGVRRQPAPTLSPEAAAAAGRLRLRRRRAHPPGGRAS